MRPEVAGATSMPAAYQLQIYLCCAIVCQCTHALRPRVGEQLVQAQLQSAAAHRQSVATAGSLPWAAPAAPAPEARDQATEALPQLTADAPGDAGRGRGSAAGTSDVIANVTGSGVTMCCNWRTKPGVCGIGRCPKGDCSWLCPAECACAGPGWMPQSWVAEAAAASLLPASPDQPGGQISNGYVGAWVPRGLAGSAGSPVCGVEHVKGVFAPTSATPFAQPPGNPDHQVHDCVPAPPPASPTFSRRWR